jgi:sugar O-acyltransferase (sialic acid O-acetyltransferase NeuD family)
MKKKIIIIGSGDHAKSIAYEIFKLKKLEFCGFIDEFKKKNTTILINNNKKYKILGNIKSLNSNILRKHYFVIGVGINYKRAKIDSELKSYKKKIKWTKIVSNDAIINPTVKIQDGSIIMSGSIINYNSEIGKHCFIGAGSIIEHHNQFLDYASCGAGVKTGGRVIVGKNSFVGLGAVIKNGIKIQENVIIGGQSMIIKDCIKNSLYAGIPGQRIKKNYKNEKYL